MKKTMVRTLSLLLTILMLMGSVVVLTANAAAESVKIKTKPNKLEYVIGDEINLSGLVLEVTYKEGTTTTTKDVSGEADGVTYTGFDSSIEGSQTVSVFYDGKSASFTVTVSPGEVTAIKAITDNAKLSYEKGEEFDSTGLALKVTYSTDIIKTVTDTKEFTCTGFNSQKTGEQKITVTYKGKQDTFTVFVKAVTSITVANPPKKTEYKIGENFDPTGMTLTVNYNFGSPKTIDKGFTCLFNSTSAGEKTVTVTYGGKSTTLKVTVLTPKVRSVSVGDVKMLFKTTAVLAPAIDAEPGVILKKGDPQSITIHYESADPSIARVDDNGKVTAVSWGETTITVTVTDATGNVVSDTCQVTVRFTILGWILRSLFGWIENWK